MTPASDSIVTLPRIFDLDALDAVRGQILDALPLGPVTIDAGAVERVATNGLFLLLAARGSARAHGHDLAIKAPSGALLAAIGQLGLVTAFADHGVGKV